MYTAISGSAYGMGSNPMGGEYVIVATDLGRRWRTVMLRLVNNRGSCPIDGGPNPEATEILRLAAQQPPFTPIDSSVPRRGWAPHPEGYLP